MWMLSSFNSIKFCYSIAWSCTPCNGPSAQELPLENSEDSYLCFQLVLLRSVIFSFSYIDHFLALSAQFLKLVYS